MEKLNAKKKNKCLLALSREKNSCTNYQKH